MNADTLAAIIADYLDARDDVASATVEESPTIASGKVAGVTVTTQGGAGYVIVVAPAVQA